MTSGPFEDRDKSAGSSVVDFSSRASISLQPQTAGFITGPCISRSLRPRQTKWGSGVVLFSGLVWEVRKAQVLFIPAHCPCVSASETQRPAPFHPLDWPGTFVLLEATPCGPCSFRVWEGGAESLRNGNDRQFSVSFFAKN